jgi:hypothetical protein
MKGFYPLGKSIEVMNLESFYVSIAVVGKYVLKVIGTIYMCIYV